jgi:hypothetical protein
MPACPNGAEPKPGSEDVQVWIDRLALAGDVATLIRSYAPLAWASIAASLTSIEGICAENPDPPEPITALDIIQQTGATISGGALLEPAVIRKAYAWLRYQQFLNFCQCKLPEPTPGNNCTGAIAPFTLPALNSVSAAFPITIDQAVLDSWALYANGDWQMSWSGSASVSGAATTGNDLFIEIQGSDGVFWNTTIDIQSLNADPDTTTFDFQVRTRRPGPATAVRVRNGAGGSYTVSNFVWCFEPLPTFPPPLPTQPPLTDTPLPPSLACATEDLCAMVTELAHRLTVIAAQVSDIQAVLTTTDRLEVIDVISMIPEGEITLALGTRAVSVELTALGDEAFTSALGRPRGLMRVGSIRWGDGVGYSPRQFIDADRFDALRPAGALSISWQLLPGTQGILKMLA